MDKLKIKQFINKINKEVLYIDLKEPNGWFVFPLKTKMINGSEKFKLF